MKFDLLPVIGTRIELNKSNTRLKHLPVMQETWVQSLGWEDPLKKEMAAHSSILAWKNPMDREAWGATVHGGHKESDVTERLTLSTFNKSLAKRI